MPRKRKFPDAGTGSSMTISYGYVGRYRSGHLGWLCPDFLGGYKDQTDGLSEDQRLIWQCHPEGQAFELCRITVEVVPGARKRWVRKPGARKRRTTP